MISEARRKTPRTAKPGMSKRSARDPITEGGGGPAIERRRSAV